MKKGWKKMTREELIRDEDFSEEEAQIIKLENKIENLEQKIEDYKDIIRNVIFKIQYDIKINERCLKEETEYNIKKLLQSWIDFDKELIQELQSDENEF